MSADGCIYTYDGADTDGTRWHLCTTHDELTMGNSWPCAPGHYVAEAGYSPAPGDCPACGELIDYCQGHGSMGDPRGAAILTLHENDLHEHCNPDGCDERRNNESV